MTAVPRELSAVPGRRGGAAGERPLRVAVVGISTRPVCGVSEYAVRLSEGLQAAGVQCSRHWLARSHGSMLASRSEVTAWARSLPDELRRSDADVVLLHYSVFSYGHRGVPLFVAPVLTALRRSRLPVVTVAHEMAFPWRLGGLRGKVWALTQRALLVCVWRRSAGVLLTTESRRPWLASRAWLPRRRTAVAPVFSNLPVPQNGGGGDESRSSSVGLFGYGYGPASAGMVLDALAALRREGIDVRLMLLGAPGADAAEGKMWMGHARSRGVAPDIGFSGMLPAQELADALASCEILLFIDPAGPTSRKTTLAAALSSGRPVLALDGPNRWDELVEAGAARVVAPQPDMLAGALRELLADRRSREMLGGRGRQFAEEQMSLARSVEVVSTLLEALRGR